MTAPPDIWTACAGPRRVCRVEGVACRVVESQEQVATAALVSSLEEQMLLEEFIESTKPPRPVDTAHLDYLLATPFRYPPLARGSRFGTPGARGIFYGALDEATALAETAYYRLLFWHGMETPPAAALRTEHLLFRAAYGTDQGLRLHARPWTRFRAALTDPASYAATQTLGAAMRGAGVAAFEFESARRAGGVNIGLFTPWALADSAPRAQEKWFSQTAADGVRFGLARPAAAGTVGWLEFPLGRFLVEGRLPAPALAV